MIESKQIEVNGQTFTLLPIPVRKAMPLEIKLLKVAVPLLQALQGISGIATIIPKGKDGNPDLSALLKTDMAKIVASLDFGAVSNALQEALGALGEHEMDDLVLGLMRYVQTHVHGKGHSTLVSGELVDLAFKSTGDMYRVVFEVARFNKFRPFDLLPTGDEIRPTAG